MFKYYWNYKGVFRSFIIHVNRILKRIENYQEETNINFSAISNRIREYFGYLSKISNTSRDNYINFLFKSFESVSGKSLDDYSIPHDLLIGKEINDSNYSPSFFIIHSFKIPPKFQVHYSQLFLWSFNFSRIFI